MTEPDGLPVLELAAPGPQRDEGVSAILAGTKTALTGLLAIYEHAGERVPRAGDRFCVVDSQGLPAASIELTEVHTVPISRIDDDYAHAEGRGYGGAGDWRRAHEEFFTSDVVADALGHVPEIDDDTPVVAIRFRLIQQQVV